MLDIDRVDLASIAEALEDHSHETDWWFNPRSGHVEPRLDDLNDEAVNTSPEDRGLIAIHPLESREGYRDMEEFTARVRNPRVRDLLERAIQGRGAFRRFKDSLFDLPELREAWFRFHDARMERRALEWLLERGVVEPAVIQRELELRADPELPGLFEARPFDVFEIARSVADDLRRLYGERLQRVILFGSWARGDANEESDLDLCVVLDEVPSPWEELRRMDDIMWRHTFANDIVVTALPLSLSQLESKEWPVTRNLEAEGLAVA